MTFDPFEVLDLPRDYDLDPSEIERRYLAAAATAHPDRFKDLDARRDAEQQSAILNRARDTLLNDESRAESLITLLGGHASSEDKTLPNGFLMEILETREEVENALTSDDPDDRVRIEKWAKDQRRQYTKRVAQLFKDHAGNPDGDALEQIRIELNAWRYIERLIERLDES